MEQLQSYEGRRPSLRGDGRAWIAPTASLIGDVSVGPDVSVWHGAALRGDNEPVRIGAGTNLQENVVVHVDPGYPTTIGTNVTIGHGAILHGCRIGDGVVVGMGAIILNGALIGDACLIAAGALILENTEIPEGSLVAGHPAKIKRALTPEERAALLCGATTYRNKAPRLLEPMA